MTLEQGKPLGEAKGEVLFAADVLEWYAEEGRRAYGRIIPAAAPDIRQMVVHEPVGVAVAMTPWNFPALTPARKIGGALAAGCTLVLKAAEEAPATAIALVEALEAAGAPPGVINLVFGDPASVSGHLIRAPQTRKVSFTGSAAVGRQLMRLAAEGLKRTTMELGGHAPVMVFDDVDAEQAARLLVAGKFRNAGQVCVAPSRFYVQDSVYDDFVEAFVDQTNKLTLGNGLSEGVSMGPLTHARRVEAMATFVADASEHNAQIRLGGNRVGNGGYFFEPTVVTDLPDDARLMTEEPFGPVAPITRFATLDEGLRRANALPVGLAAYAFTNDSARAMAVSDGLKAGMVGINTLSVSTPETPFGGVGESGHGQEGGTEGLAAYLDVKFIAHAVSRLN
jgi:succinate-semialdehyde dehydrogenase/glutarate-semialdehyde dehydrogenase